MLIVVDKKNESVRDRRAILRAKKQEKIEDKYLLNFTPGHCVQEGKYIEMEFPSVFMDDSAEVLLG
jgi:hypothetical protein